MAAKRSTHLDEAGRAHMVDVGEKAATQREAVAVGRVRMSDEALRSLVDGTVEKGDVLGVARVAGIQAAKRTSEWIPLAHPLSLESVKLSFEPAEQDSAICIEARVRVTAKTGVEMEAMTAVCAAALTVYDMCKSIDRGMVIDDVKLVRKSGGKSGLYELPGSDSGA
jgi:cyclic pyranopterin phosphate synthase